jgi:hypothetical protein
VLVVSIEAWPNHERIIPGAAFSLPMRTQWLIIQCVLRAFHTSSHGH